MSKFDQKYKAILENMGIVQSQKYDNPALNASPNLKASMTNAPAAGRNTNLNSNLTPQQKADLSNQLVNILNTLPRNVSTDNTGNAVAVAFNKAKAAGSKALDVVGNMTVKDILNIAYHIGNTPNRINQSVIAGAKQAGTAVGDALRNMVKQKGVSDQEINQIINQIKQEQGQSKGPMSADRAAAGYED